MTLWAIKNKDGTLALANQVLEIAYDGERVPATLIETAQWEAMLAIEDAAANHYAENEGACECDLCLAHTRTKEAMGDA